MVQAHTRQAHWHSSFHGALEAASSPCLSSLTGGSGFGHGYHLPLSIFHLFSMQGPCPETSLTVFIHFWSAESWALRSTHSGPSARHPCCFQAHFWEGHGDPSPKNNSSLGVPGMTWSRLGRADSHFCFAGIEALFLRHKSFLRCGRQAHP